MELAVTEKHPVKTKWNFTIRAIAAGDKEKLYPLIRQEEAFNEKEIEVAIEVLEDSIASPEKSGYYTYCAVEDNGEIAGFICFGPIPLTDGCYDLYWIAVDKKFSRNGVGQRLLNVMEDFAAKEKVRRIYIDTSSTAPYIAARTFYETNGYRLECVFKDFYRIGDDKVIFIKEISDNKK